MLVPSRRDSTMATRHALHVDITRSCRFRPAVAMMETAQSPHRYNVGSICRAAFDCSFGGSALVQANVGPVLMIVANVAAPKPPKMIFIERNNMVEQFATRAAHPTFRRSVLPGTPNARAHGLEITGSQKVQNVLSEFGIMDARRAPARIFLFHSAD